MPAYFDSGFSVRKPMWHGQGEVLADYPTDWDDARRKAGLEWEPMAVPSYTRQPITATNEPRPGSFPLGDGTMMVPSTKSKTVVRNDTLAELGPVSQGHGLVYHRSMGEIVEAILGAGAKFETAGSCNEGANVWALAYLDEPVTIAGDDTETLPFLALLNAHDGSGACKLTFTSVRVVCWNTYNAASLQGERTGRQFTFRHTANVLDRIGEAKEALSGLRNEAAEWKALAEDLYKVRADDAALTVFTQTFIPVENVVSERVRANVATARATFTKLYNESPTTDGHRGTALGLVDAAVEYLDHLRGYRSRDTYMNRTLLRSEPFKARALTLAREACGHSANWFSRELQTRAAIDAEVARAGFVGTVPDVVEVTYDRDAVSRETEPGS